jgi:hypothetical protein
MRLVFLPLFCVASFSDCFRYENAIVESDMTIAPLACFEFLLPVFRNITLAINLESNASTNFFGSNNGERPVRITALQSDVGNGASLDYERFRQPIPLFCSSEIPESYTGDVVAPDETKTSDGYDLKFEIVYERQSGFYSDHFQGQGDCVMLIRFLPSFDGPDITTAQCVGIALGLILAAVFVAACVIFVLPRLATNDEDEREPESVL